MIPSEDSEILINCPLAHCDKLLTEYKQAGVMPTGFYAS